MKPVNTQNISNDDLVIYNKSIKPNNKVEDTYFLSDSIGVLTSVFQKLVTPVSVRQ